MFSTNTRPKQTAWSCFTSVINSQPGQTRFHGCPCRCIRWWRRRDILAVRNVTQPLQETDTATITWPTSSRALCNMSSQTRWSSMTRVKPNDAQNALQGPSESCGASYWLEEPDARLAAELTEPPHLDMAWLTNAPSSDAPCFRPLCHNKPGTIQTARTPALISETRGSFPFYPNSGNKCVFPNSINWAGPSSIVPRGETTKTASIKHVLN